MSRYARRSGLVAISTVLLQAEARAEPLRLEQRLAPACVAAARELRPRIERAIGGSLPRELEASVAIDALGSGYRITIALRDGAETRGATVIEAPTCDEAVDAATVVLALAFGKMKGPEGREPASTLGIPEQSASARSALSREVDSFAESVPTENNDRHGARGDERLRLDSARSSGSERATRISLGTGLDGGTLPHPTLTLASAVARSFGGIELAAIARYGLPITQEVVENGFSASQRHEFGGLELRACRGVGSAIRLSACAGTEVDAVRARRRLRSEDGAHLDAERVSGRLSGTLAALVAHRGGLIEPALELTGAAVALGHDAGAPWFVVRVAAGAGFAF